MNLHVVVLVLFEVPVYSLRFSLRANHSPPSMPTGNGETTPPDPFPSGPTIDPIKDFTRPSPHSSFPL